MALIFFRVGYNIKKAITEDFFYKDRDSQITAIENTFEKAKQSVSNSFNNHTKLCQKGKKAVAKIHLELINII